MLPVKMLSNGESDFPHRNDSDNHTTIKWEDFIIERSVEDLNYTGLVNHTSLEPLLASYYLNLATFIITSVLIGISVCSNMIVLVITTYRINRETNISSIHFFMRHLSFADIVVTAVFLPAQAGWIRIDEWKAGDAACKTFAFFNIFGRYLAASLVVCISIDRYIEVIRLIHGLDIRQRTGVMKALAWAGSIFCSAVEALLHGVRSYPYPSVWRICSSGPFSSTSAEVAYDVIKASLLCGFPTAVTTVCYTSILWKVFRFRRLSGAAENGGRRNALACIKKRSVKLSIIAGLVFSICWGPPFMMKLWFWIDEEFAFMIDPKLWNLLLVFACSSICFHPVVYGYFFLKR